MPPFGARLPAVVTCATAHALRWIIALRRDSWVAARCRPPPDRRRHDEESHRHEARLAVDEEIENDDARPRALDGVTYLFSVAALGVSLLVAAALQPRVLGAAWISCAIVTALASLILVEIVLRDWNRVPFTCTYLPGKRVLAYTLGVLLAWYAVFVFIGANLTRWSILHPSRTRLYGGLLLAAFAALRRARLRNWGTRRLEFEDEDPVAIRGLGLLPDERRNTG